MNSFQLDAYFLVIFLIKFLWRKQIKEENYVFFTYSYYFFFCTHLIL
jgi:hypothetical protein